MAYVLIYAKIIFYLVLAAHCLYYRRIPRLSGGSYDAWLKVNHKHIWTLHGVIVFACLRGARVTGGENIFQYLAGSIMIWALWEGGITDQKILHFDINDLWACTLQNLHHLGAVVALVYQPEEEASRADRNTVFFAWLWIIHSFLWIQRVVLPLLGMPKLENGGKYQSMEIARYAYGAATVYLFYDFVASQGQPGFGRNYQTAAVVVMLTGRFFSFDNFVLVPFISRVEFPGCMIVGLRQLVLIGERKVAAAVAVILATHWARSSELLKTPQV